MEETIEKAPKQCFQELRPIPVILQEKEHISLPLFQNIKSCSVEWECKIAPWSSKLQHNSLICNYPIATDCIFSLSPIITGTLYLPPNFILHELLFSNALGKWEHAVIPRYIENNIKIFYIVYAKCGRGQQRVLSGVLCQLWIL